MLVTTPTWAEIKIIDPEIIVTGVSYGKIFKNLFQDFQLQDTGHDIWVGKYLNAKLIHFYHPSARTAPAAFYYLLEKVFRSKVFNSL